MVKGLKAFSAHFADHEDQYVLIGGTALWLLMDEAGLQTRATKDLDIVLCVEALDAGFIAAFWRFIEQGGYRQQEKSSGKKIFYRFREPEAEGFPVMLELFSRQPDGIALDAEAHLTPIPAGEEAASLSAILLDDDYYRLLHARKRKLEGVSLADEACILLLKAYAWLDLVERKHAGEPVDSKIINKHRNDILRLYQLLDPAKPVEVPERIADNIARFIADVADEVDAALLRNLGIRDVAPGEILEAIDRHFLVAVETN